ncbi:hypothetical protein [Halorussus sp. MSC15.2]|uniref:hypothetical protein n=1 Tax=Halorussus sp. MSC15.2 TaxID=2283638 RepID=UPI0013D13578|nr:hypothetical protein [Halorussus sp. MSC15.2]NEU58978.1 hypothetical protein [Halorussus sp. MSC15.2]
MAYTLKDSKYNGDTGGDQVLEVNVLKASNPDAKYWDKTYNFVVDTLDSLYNDGYVPATIARKYDTDKTIDCNNKFSDGNSWLNDNNFGDGMYLWVVKCDTAVAHDRNGWAERRQGFIGTTRYPNAHQTAFSGVHEALHPYIYADVCDEVQKFGVSSDHELGKVLNTGSLLNPNQASTMLGHYGQSVAEASDSCDRWKSVDRYKNEQTVCTKKSLKRSWQHDAGQH